MRTRNKTPLQKICGIRFVRNYTTHRRVHGAAGTSTGP
jgi:hypothetical protein